MISELYSLQKWINGSDNIVCITGPDFSKEAGFPDYRVMEEGFLDTYKYTPQEILKVSFLQRYPFFFYKFFRLLRWIIQSFFCHPVNGSNIPNISR